MTGIERNSLERREGGEKRSDHERHQAELLQAKLTVFDAMAGRFTSYPDLVQDGVLELQSGDCDVELRRHDREGHFEYELNGTARRNRKREKWARGMGPAPGAEKRASQTLVSVSDAQGAVTSVEGLKEFADFVERAEPR